MVGPLRKRLLIRWGFSTNNKPSRRLTEDGLKMEKNIQWAASVQWGAVALVDAWGQRSGWARPVGGVWEGDLNSNRRRLQPRCRKASSDRQIQRRFRAISPPPRRALGTDKVGRTEWLASVFGTTAFPSASAVRLHSGTMTLLVRISKHAFLSRLPPSPACNEHTPPSLKSQP